MPYSGGIIKTETRDGIEYGVSIYDVQQALSSTANDIGRLCKSDAINKWARYKPISLGYVLGQLTYTQISDAHFGLTPIENDLMYNKSDAPGRSEVQNTTELDEIFAANAQWTYNKPTGLITSPFRLSDFAQPINDTGHTLDTSYGYNHNTPPPVERVKSMAVGLKAIRACCNNAGITSTAGSSYGDWVLNDTHNTSPLYSNLAFRYGEASQYQVNDASTYAISLPHILGMTTNQCWRIAVAVQVPSSTGALSYMRLFTSKMTFADAQEVSDNVAQCLMPSLGTNQYLCKMIDEYAYYLVHTISSGTTDKIGNTKVSVTNPTFKLPACLCVVQDMYMGHEARTGSSTPYTHCYLSSGSKVYSAPALLTEFEIIVNDDDFNEEEITAYTHLSLTLVGTGNIAIMGSDSSKRIPINEIRLTQLQPVTSDMVIYYRYSCTWIERFDGDTKVDGSDTITSSVTLKAGAVEGDSNWIDRSIKGNPALYLVSKEQSTSPIT